MEFKEILEILASWDLKVSRENNLCVRRELFDKGRGVLVTPDLKLKLFAGEKDIKKLEVYGGHVYNMRVTTVGRIIGCLGVIAEKYGLGLASLESPNSARGPYSLYAEDIPPENRSYCFKAEFDCGKLTSSILDKKIIDVLSAQIEFRTERDNLLGNGTSLDFHQAEVEKGQAGVFGFEKIKSLECLVPEDIARIPPLTALYERHGTRRFWNKQAEELVAYFFGKGIAPKDIAKITGIPYNFAFNCCEKRR